MGNKIATTSVSDDVSFKNKPAPMAAPPPAAGSQPIPNTKAERVPRKRKAAKHAAEATPTTLPEEESSQQPEITKVYLNIYKICAWRAVPGVYHTSISLGSNEFAFCGGFKFYPEYENGKRIGEFESLFKYVKSIELGELNMTYQHGTYNDLIGKVMRELSDEFSKTGSNYNLIHKNCNHFADAFATKLLGKKVVPAWVNGLAKTAGAVSKWFSRSSPVVATTPLGTAQVA